MRFDLLAVNVAGTTLLATNVILLSKIIYNAKFNSTRIPVFSLLFGILNGTISYLVNLFIVDYFIVKTVTAFVISVVLIRIILNLDIKKSIILFGIYLIIIFISDFGMVLIFKLLNAIYASGVIDTFKEDTKNVIAGNLITYIIALIIILLIKFFKAYFRLPKKTGTIVFTVVITTFTIAANVWFIYYNVKTYTNIILFIIVPILMVIYCIYVIFNINVSYKFEKQSIDLEQQKFYNESLDKTLDNFRRFKHGYNNNLNVLYCFAKSGQYGKLIEYFDEIIEINNKLNDTTAYNIKNAALYGVVSTKIQYAEELGVEFKIITDGEVKEIERITMAELCEILGIILDNAIEAACKSEDKLVIMNISQDEECISILVKNSFDGEAPNLNKIFAKGYSTKGEGRGMGLWIVKDILKKYKHVLNNAYVDKNMFCQELVIKKGG